MPRLRFLGCSPIHCHQMVVLRRSRSPLRRWRCCLAASLIVLTGGTGSGSAAHFSLIPSLAGTTRSLSRPPWRPQEAASAVRAACKELQPELLSDSRSSFGRGRGIPTRSDSG